MTKTDVSINKYLDDFTPEEINAVKSLLHDEKSDKRIKSLQDSLYRVKPPTPLEFITNWIGPGFNLYPHVIEMFCDMWDYESDYHETVYYGATRCHGKDVPILLYDGTIKKVQDVKVGDVLVGDDGKKRFVLETTKGKGQLYEVEQPVGINYTVNLHHKLVLKHFITCEIKEISVEDYLQWDDPYKKLWLGYKVYHNRKGDGESEGYAIDIRKLEVDNFYGFLVSDNHRYLLSDATVVRNTGKSVCSRLSIVYCIVWLWCLKDPHAYYNLSKISSLALFLMCFAKKKSVQLLLKPIENILKSSPKFHQVIFADQIDKVQEKLGNDKIVWSTASKIGDIGFSNDIHICVGSNPMDIIGADIIMAVISELNYFLNVPGISEEDIWNVYTKTKDRIDGTIAKRYGAMLILDSSANNRDSVIEDYILNKASKDKNVYFRRFNRWEAVPDRFPIWQKTGQTFDVFVGDQSRAPIIVDETFRGYPGDERKTIQVPIDAKDLFTKDIYSALRDIGGVPTGSENLFFPNMEVTKVIFDDNLPNITAPVEAPISSSSVDLIINKIKHIFMKQDVTGKWVLKRARSAPRWLRVDLSEKSDRTGLSMCHPEITNEGLVYAVFDFAFDVSPGRDGINLDSILDFVRGLYKKFHISVVGISTDKYQSSFIAQSVKKDDKNYRLISVDLTKTPYMVYKTKVLNGTIRVGYYVNIYNNMRSLIETKSRIEHQHTRKDSEDNKKVGIEAKDITDSMAGAVYHMFSEVGKYSVRYNYDDITKTIEVMNSYDNNKELSNIDKAQLYSNLIKNVMSRNVKMPPHLSPKT